MGRVEKDREIRNGHGRVENGRVVNGRVVNGRVVNGRAQNRARLLDYHSDKSILELQDFVLFSLVPLGKMK